jgi:hypothetical protein
LNNKIDSNPFIQLILYSGIVQETIVEKENPKVFASNYQDWQPIYNWGTCKTGREEYGKFLCSFLTSSKEGLVVNLNGTWGTGKTELLRRIYVELAERQHPVVYINAWESDFCDDALSVISSEFLNQLEVAFGNNGDPRWLSKFNNLKQKLGKALKFGALGATISGEPNAATLLGATSAAVNTLPDLASVSVSDNNIRLIEKISSNHANRVQAMKEVREQISALAVTMEIVCGAKLPIVVLVDELDRCRPTYAIEMLEVIKHFFEAKGCVFLVATDTAALEHSIKAVYGASFESEKYLRRFFDRRIALPPLSIIEYLKAKALDFTQYESKPLRLFPFTDINAQLIKIFALLFENAQMSLRDVEQSLQKCIASLEYLQSLGTKPQIVNVIVLMMGTIEQQSSPESLLERTNNQSVNYRGKVNSPDMTDLNSVQLSLVVEGYSTTMHRGHGRSNKYPQPENMLIIQHTDYSQKTSIVKHNLFDDIQHLLLSYIDSHVKYFLWDDYKRIIELSGYIE